MDDLIIANYENDNYLFVVYSVNSFPTVSIFDIDEIISNSSK
jgi:hypothetical protein